MIQRDHHAHPGLHHKDSDTGPAGETHFNLLTASVNSPSQADRWRAISIRSAHPDQTVRTHLSEQAFALGLCGGIFTPSVPAADSTAPNAPVNCPARTRISNRNRLADAVALVDRGWLEAGPVTTCRTAPVFAGFRFPAR